LIDYGHLDSIRADYFVTDENLDVFVNAELSRATSINWGVSQSTSIILSLTRRLGAAETLAARAEASSNKVKSQQMVIGKKDAKIKRLEEQIADLRSRND
jgi:hypothetical protein